MWRKIRVKCKYCGADLTMEDEVCPFCHNPNPYYVKHREDMHRYEQDYQETKSDVYETAGKTSRKATQIAILAVLGGLFPLFTSSNIFFTVGASFVNFFILRSSALLLANLS